jgi:hypothetical protein
MNKLETFLKVFGVAIVLVANITILSFVVTGCDLGAEPELRCNLYKGTVSCQLP